MKLEELGRRAVACKHWRWMPGMRIVNPRATLGRGRMGGARYCTLGFDDEAFVLESKNAGSISAPSKNNDNWQPDLSDPATLGCLLALVREAWRAPHAAPQWDQRWQHWAVLGPNYNEECESWTNHGAGDTEAEALVAALEAAP